MIHFLGLRKDSSSSVLDQLQLPDQLFSETCGEAITSHISINLEANLKRAFEILQKEKRDVRVFPATGVKHINQAAKRKRTTTTVKEVMPLYSLDEI